MNLIKVFETVVFSSLMGSLIVFFTLIIKGVFRNKLNPVFHYYIWIILLVKLIIPFAPQNPLNIFNVYEKYYIQSQHSTNTENTQVKSSLQSVNIGSSNKVSSIDFYPAYKNFINDTRISDVDKKHSIERVLCFIWLLGVSLTIGVLLLGYKRLKGITTGPTENIKYTHKEILKHCLGAMNISVEPKLIYSAKVNSPSFCGFLKPKILVPIGIVSNVCDEEFKFIIIHELAHFKNKDIFINWVITLLSAIYWFNPILLYGFHKIKQDCEVACDAEAISYLAKGENIPYGNVLIKILELTGNSRRCMGAIPMVMNKSEIKRRIIMISKYKKISRKGILLGVVAIGMVAAIGLSMTIVKANAQKNNKKIETTQINSASKEKQAENVTTNEALSNKENKQVNSDNNNKKSPSNVSDIKNKDYSQIGMKLKEQTIMGMFGGNEGGRDAEAVSKKLGKPTKIVDKSDYHRWYFKQGVEIDVVKQNDVFLMIFNKVYINPSCKMKTPRNIGIGSSKDEVLKAYKEEINEKLTENQKIIAGDNRAGITFVMKNNKVNEIFISTGAYTY